MTVQHALDPRDVLSPELGVRNQGFFNMLDNKKSIMINKALQCYYSPLGSLKKAEKNILTQKGKEVHGAMPKHNSSTSNCLDFCQYAKKST